MKNHIVKQQTETAPPVPETNNSPTSNGGGVMDASPTNAAVQDYGMPVHPVCAIFPMMPDDQLEELAKDIKTNGLIEHVVRHESNIIDGRHRVLACRRAGVEPKFVEWCEKYAGPMTVSQWILSVNARRRHMTRVELAAAHLAVSGWEEREDARRRIMEGRRKGGETAGRGRPKAGSSLVSSPGSNSSGATPSEAPVCKPDTGPKKAHSEGLRSDMSGKFSISKYQSQQLLDVAKAAPELLPEISQGNVQLPQAAAVAKARTNSQKVRPPAESQYSGPLSQKKKAALKQAEALEKLITKAVHAVENVLKSVPEDKREKFKSEVAKTVRNLV